MNKNIYKTTIETILIASVLRGSRLNVREIDLYLTWLFIAVKVH
jgi:hypothetical protein